MGTKEDCKNGHHTTDNQGLCHWCGKLLNPDWWEAYAGKRHIDDDRPKKTRCKRKVKS